jgi:hypothetical protein
VDQESFEQYVPASFRQLVDGFREYRPHMRGCVRKSPYRTRPIYPFSSRVTERVYSGKRSMQATVKSNNARIL